MAKEIRTNFEIEVLEEAKEFLDQLDEAARRKIIYNLRKAQCVNDVKLFKKLNEDIWEFRTVHRRTQYRILAFWKRSKLEVTLVVATHGFVKKSRKTPSSQIKRAEEIMKLYNNQTKES